MPGLWLRPVTRRDPWWPRWSSRDAVATRIRLLPGCSGEISTLESANRVYVVVQGTAIVGTATNDAEPPVYSVSPREMTQVIKSGTQATADAVAALILLVRKKERFGVQGLAVPLRHGLGIQRGETVQLTLPRAGISGQYPVRRLQHDFGTVTTVVDLGDFDAPRTADDVSVRLARMLARLEKEIAT